MPAQRWKIRDDYNEGTLIICVDEQGDIILETEGSVRFTGAGGGSRLIKACRIHS